MTDTPATGGSTGRPGAAPNGTSWLEADRLLGALDPGWTTLMESLTGTMFCAKDVTGRYVVVNQAFVDRTGERTRRAVLGRRAEDLFPAHLADHYAAQDRTVLGSGEPLRRELELISRPGGPPGWYLSSKVPVRAGGEVVGLVSVSEDLRTRAADDVTVRSLHRVAALVAERLHGPVPVAAMAQAAGCSPSTLDRRMRKVFALSPQQYVLRCRVDRAAALLSAGELPLAEVATAAGFSDQALLTRTFGRLTGETPAQFRRRTSGTAAPGVG